jgi:exopolyphosphatase
MAYDIAHTKHNVQKAVALLQVEESAIDLRPENKLALAKAGMERGHKDLLGGSKS